MKDKVWFVSTESQDAITSLDRKIIFYL